MEQLDNIITLNDENGNEVDFEYLDLIEYKNEKYIVLLPCEDGDDAGEVVILMVENFDTDSEAYVSVDDEKTLGEVFEIFKDRFKDEFSFVD